MDMQSSVAFSQPDLVAALEPTDLVLDFTDNQRHFDGVEPDRVEGLVRRTLSREGVGSAEISLLLVDDDAIREINRRHLAHDWPTDVITFPLSGPREEPLCGELVISAEMALATAETVGADPWAELALYIVHGLLHLRGHDDQSPDDSEAMRRRESFHLEAEGLINTFDLVDSNESASGREGRPCPA